MIRRLFRPQPNFSYPLMRDPARQPKCYEMTDQERAEAILKVDRLLQDRNLENSQGYYGA